MTLPTVRSIANTRTSGASAVIAPPAGVQSGDWLLILANVGNTATPTVVPTGWQDVQYGGWLGTRRAYAWAVQYTGQENWTATWASSVAISWSVIAFNGAGAANTWVNGVWRNRQEGSPPSTPTTAVAPTITTTAPDTLVLCASFEATTTAGDTAAVSQGTKIVEYFPGTESIVVASLNMTAPGVVSDTTVTYNNAQVANGGAFHVGIPASNVPAGLPVAVVTQNGPVEGRLHVVTASDTKPVLSLHQIKAGYPSVDAMLAATPFFVAHRGGSVSYPEMSLHAYTQSVVRGFGALELSLARTSDGVWFGLHDATLDRTSGITGATASTMTWAQVQQHQILASTTNNPSQPNRPYMLWDELIEAYYETHVIFVDPKATWNFRSELLEMMDELPNSTERLVAKYHGIEGNTAGTTGWAYEAGQRGYTRWGYFYEDDLANGNIATFQGRWDILGMEHGAAQSVFDAVLAYGKPVIGHICSNQTAVNSALSKGADGVMCSGTGVITPTTP